MDPAIQPAVRKKLEADHNCTPVFLTQEVTQHRAESCVLCDLWTCRRYVKWSGFVRFSSSDRGLVDVFLGTAGQVEDLYYHRFTQGVLWPLFHCIPTNFNEALLENFQSQYEVRTSTLQHPASKSRVVPRLPEFWRCLIALCSPTPFFFEKRGGAIPCMRDAVLCNVGISRWCTYGSTKACSNAAASTSTVPTTRRTRMQTSCSWRQWLASMRKGTSCLCMITTLCFYLLSCGRDFPILRADSSFTALSPPPVSTL